MKNIAYIEIDTHAEIAQAFMEAMSGSVSFLVDYYFSEKIRDQVTARGESVILSDRSIILDQLGSKAYDLVIIGTVHRYFSTFQAMVGRYPSAVIVHNRNFMHASRWQLFRSIFREDVLYRLKLCWKEGLMNAPQVYRNARHLLVLDAQLATGRLKFLPLFFTVGRRNGGAADSVIVIPGGVSQKRRDYFRIFSLLRNLRPAKPYRFVFLGKAKGEELKELEKLASELSGNLRITYFSERVPSGVFDEWMQKADVLWCPVRQEAEFFSQREIYGRTKMTGNLGDAIKAGKWAVFPENYASGVGFIVPEQQDIISQFESLKNKPNEFREAYSKPSVQAQLEKLLEELAAT